jgi:hypothetical protein
MADSHAGNLKMWPLTAETLQGLSVIALWVATVSGAIAVGAGFLSTIAANRASGLTQADADSRIAGAELKGREALARAAEANAEAAQANERAARFEKDAEELRLQTAQARISLKEYREGRSLSGEQKKILGEVLSNEPKGPVIIKPNFLSAEPTRYANELSDVFNRAGYSGVGDKPLSVVSTNRPGLFVIIKDLAHRPAQLPAIARAFREAHIPFSAHAESYVPDVRTVVILVGERP